jgi:hypothetical protein
MNWVKLRACPKSKPTNQFHRCRLVYVSAVSSRSIDGEVEMVLRIVAGRHRERRPGWSRSQRCRREPAGQRHCPQTTKAYRAITARSGQRAIEHSRIIRIYRERRIADIDCEVRTASVSPGACPAYGEREVLRLRRPARDRAVDRYFGCPNRRICTGAYGKGHIGGAARPRRRGTRGLEGASGPDAGGVGGINGHNRGAACHQSVVLHPESTCVGGQRSRLKRHLDCSGGKTGEGTNPSHSGRICFGTNLGSIGSVRLASNSRSPGPRSADRIGRCGAGDLRFSHFRGHRVRCGILERLWHFAEKLIFVGRHHVRHSDH